MRGISLVSRTWRARARAAARTFACGLVIATVVLGLSLRAARAKVSESLLGFGAELATWESARLHSAPRQLSLNGLELGLVTATSDESVRENLDRFHALCRKRGGISLPASVRAALPGSLDGTFRQESADEGVLACLDTGKPLDLDELGSRLQAFMASGDLKALGQLRYVFARKSGKKTTLVVLWTDGSVPLLRMFPESGDAPGRDPVGVPRSPKTRRLLSAAEHGAPYSMALYAAVGQPPEALQSWYEEAFRAEGWAVSPTGTTGTLLARQGERSVLVRVAASKGARTVVSVSEL